MSSIDTQAVDFTAAVDQSPMTLTAFFGAAMALALAVFVLGSTMAGVQAAGGTSAATITFDGP
jgi:hypothetical protein